MGSDASFGEGGGSGVTVLWLTSEIQTRLLGLETGWQKVSHPHAVTWDQRQKAPQNRERLVSRRAKTAIPRKLCNCFADSKILKETELDLIL